MADCLFFCKIVLDWALRMGLLGGVEASIFSLRIFCTKVCTSSMSVAVECCSSVLAAAKLLYIITRFYEQAGLILL